jgi:hypothetical protein
MSVEEYKQLIRSFLSEAITASVFETRYLSAFKNEPGGMGREVFFILQDLFEDVDAYTHYWPPPPDLHYVISEDELRDEAQVALDALEKLNDSGGAQSARCAH